MQRLLDEARYVAEAILLFRTFGTNVGSRATIVGTRTDLARIGRAQRSGLAQGNIGAKIGGQRVAAIGVPVAEKTSPPDAKVIVPSGYVAERMPPADIAAERKKVHRERTSDRHDMFQ
ncbi:hypothetical protein [Pelagibacterium halotolerans]|uniref:hypothetical protein n=1 Tax=Pelagibacterium halotolerans TaxID=531813 RepID=UPI00384AE231